MLLTRMEVLAILCPILQRLKDTIQWIALSTFRTTDPVMSPFPPINISLILRTFLNNNFKIELLSVNAKSEIKFLTVCLECFSINLF